MIIHSGNNSSHKAEMLGGVGPGVNISVPELSPILKLDVEWLSSPGVGVVGLAAVPCCCSPSFFIRLSLARRFWNQTWMTRMSSPVSCESCSRTWREGLELWV